MGPFMRRLGSSSLAVVLVVLSGCFRNDAAVEVMDLKTPGEIMRANCGTCHGNVGEGGWSWVDPTWPAPTIAGYPANPLGWHVRNGHAPMMPAIPEQEISEEELAALALYIEGLPMTAEPDPAFDHLVLVTDEDPWFSPMQLSINAGETVRFKNVGKTYHPVIDLQDLLAGGDGACSGNIGPNGTWDYTFMTEGDFTFLCGMHPYMRGSIHVNRPFTPPSYAPAAPMALPAVPGVGEIWVNCQFQDWPGRTQDGVIQVIDASTFTVTHTIPLGNNPHNLWFSAGNQQALVTNWFDATVSLIDATTKTEVGTYVAGAAPAHVTSDFAGTRWFVSMEGSNYVQMMSQDPFGSWPLTGLLIVAPRAWSSGYGPHGVWYGTDRLVTSNSMDNTFSIYDVSQTTTMPELARLPAGKLPLGASCNTQATFGAAGNGLSGTVSLYDLVNKIWIRDIPMSGGTVQVPFTPDGTKIFAANGSRCTIIDVNRAANPANWPNPLDAIDASIPTGRGAHGVAFGGKAGGGLYAYVSHKFENYVSVIDVSSQTHVGDIPLTLSTTGKLSLAGCTDTGGNGISVRPSPVPWK